MDPLRLVNIGIDNDRADRKKVIAIEFDGFPANCFFMVNETPASVAAGLRRLADQIEKEAFRVQQRSML